MAEEMNLWGYAAQAENENSNFGDWHWGVNFDVRLKNIEYHAKTKRDDNTELPPKVVISFKEKDNDSDSAVKTLEFYEPSTEEQKDFNGNVLIKGSKEFIAAFKKKVSTIEMALCGLGECFMDETELKNKLEKVKEMYAAEKKPYGFAEYINTFVKIIKSQNGWSEKPLDLFLQWNSKLSKNGNSYLVISNANMGKYVCVHQEGEWEEEKIPFHHYRLYLKENGVKTQKLHPIMRGNFEYFWKNNAEKIEVAPEKKADDFISDLEGGKTETPTTVDDIWGGIN